MQYQVRFHLWKIDAASPEEGKKKICDLLRQYPEWFIAVEPFKKRQPLWKQLLWGPK